MAPFLFLARDFLQWTRSGARNVPASFFCCFVRGLAAILEESAAIMFAVSPWKLAKGHRGPTCQFSSNRDASAR